MDEQIKTLFDDMHDRIVYLFDLTDESYEVLIERIVELAEELQDGEGD